jgi:Na+-transporting methylmalonyl-CoA/oxaloacetate decarboxylase gamma subunit
VTAALAPRLPADQRRPADEARGTRALIASFAGMAGEAEPDLPLWELLNAETLSTQMDTGSRQEIHRSIEAQVRARVASIVLPPERRVVLTSRDATIPLRFRNDLPYPVQVRVTYRSPRLEVDGGGVQTVVLQPGENRIDLDVSVQAPGSAILRVGVTSPDSQIAIGQSSLPVTSSRISGVGAVLSVLSILVLAGWWILTVRRSRRERRAGRTDTSDPQPPPDRDTATGDVAATVGGRADAPDLDGAGGSVVDSG